MNNSNSADPRDKVASSRGGPVQDWVDMIATRSWRSAVADASGGMSNSRLDVEILDGSQWASAELSERTRLFERAMISVPSRGKKANSLGIDIVGLAEIKWPGTLAVFEHPLWDAWRDPPRTFSDIVAAVEEALEFLTLGRDRSAVAGFGLVAAQAGEREHLLLTFETSVSRVSAELAPLNRLLLLTVLFREADVLRLPTAAFLMDSLCEAIAVFSSSTDEHESIDEIETALLFSRWEIVLDDPSTISNSLDALAPIESAREATSSK